MFLITFIATVSSCAPQLPRPPSDPVTKSDSDYAYTAKIKEGQVYLQLNTNPSPGGRIGPFVKQSDGKYICDTKNKGMHSLSKSKDGEWFYRWSYIHMRAQRVNASILENKKENP